jgi:hypothetical protein
VKLLIAVAVLSALGAVAGAVWLGSQVREDTVVARPYEEGLQYDAERRRLEGRCDVSRAPCTLPLGGGAEVTLDLGPRPLRTMRTLWVNVALREGGAPMAGGEVTVSFEMPGMDMGENATHLSPSGSGRHVGEGVLVRCPSGRRDWIATVSVRRSGADERTARFPLRVEE